LRHSPLPLSSQGRRAFARRIRFAVPLSQAITPDAHRPPTQEQIARARTMYAEGFAVSRILAYCDMSIGTLYYWLDGGPLEAEGPRLPPIPRRRDVIGRRRRKLKGDPVSLNARLWRTCERQARDIEERLRKRQGAPAERDLRMLALLVRALRDLAMFDAAHAMAPERAGAPSPEEADARRAELMRRLEAMRLHHEAMQARSAAAPPVGPA
jgi:hypothetical protein